MFFNKKNKNADGEKNNNKKKPSMKRKSKGNTLAISVPEAATESLQNNEEFIINDQTVGAATKISEAIGDLSDKKNSDIGQIVNYINHGTISAVVLEQLLEDDTIIIVPDSETIATMRTYDSFKNAEYELCYVDLENGKIAPCFEEERKISFDDLESIANGNESLSKFLGISSGASSSNDSFDDFDDEDEDDDEYSDPLYSDDFDNDNNFNTEPSENEFEGTDYNEDLSDSDFMADTQPESEPSVSNEEQQPAPVPPDPFAETTQETITQLVTRVFMVDDVKLEVTEEPFNMQFNTSDLVLFDENRSTDEGDGVSNHLNECLNNMAKAANAEIKQSRMTHLNALRSRYMNDLGEYAKTSINDTVSVYGDTYFANERKKIDEEYHNQCAQIENEVSMRRASIDKEFNETIVNVRAAAAEAAEHEYRENHQKQYAARVDSIRNVIEQEIENKHANDVMIQNEERHKVAVSMLDDGIVKTLENLTVEYADMVVEERAIYQKHMESMLDFMSHQRFNEMHRIKVLHDEQARVDVAEKMSAKHAADVAEITAKFNAQKKALEADLKSMRENVDIAVNRATAEAERTIANLRAENQRLTNNVENTQSKLEAADERAQEKYKYEIENLNNQLSRWEDESTRIHGSQKLVMFTMLGLATAAVIAAAAIGYISGQSHQAKQYTNSIQMGYDTNNSSLSSSTSSAVTSSGSTATNQSVQTNESNSDSTTVKSNAVPESGSVTVKTK